MDKYKNGYYRYPEQQQQQQQQQQQLCDRIMRL